MKTPFPLIAALFLLACLALSSARGGTMIYVSSPGNNTIMKYTLGGVGSVFANTGLDYPTGLAFDGAGNLFAADTRHNRVVKFTPGGVGSVFVSMDPRRGGPFALAFDSAGSLYTEGGPEIINYTAGGIYSSFSLADFPNALVFDSTGTLLVANEFGGLAKVPATGGLPTEFVTSKLPGEDFAFFPFGLALDIDGNIFVSHEGGNAIVMLTPGGAILDYVGSDSGLNAPLGMALNSVPNHFPTRSQAPETV